MNKGQGDGTEGKTTDPLMTILRLARDVLTKEYSPTSEFRPGDIVYDSKNNEHGIVLGEKPSPVCGNIKQLLSMNSNQRTSGNVTMFLATFYKVPGYENNYDWRIRYTNSRYLVKIEDIRLARKTQSDSDLKNFCENSCFLDCSADCPLWKYRKGIHL